MDKVNSFDERKIFHKSFFMACKEQKAVKEAFRFQRLLNNPCLRTFNMLLSVCRHAKDVDGALRVFAAVENAGLKPDSILYTTLISTCSKAGNVDIAFKVFHDMETAGVQPNVHTFGAMIDGCAQAGHLAKAFGVYGIMISKQLKPDCVIFNSLINACGRSGAIERAFDVLADMKAEATPIMPNHVTICALISACARAGQVDRAFEVYTMMKQSGIKGTPECYTAAVHACSDTGNLERALGVYKDMKNDGVQPDEVFFSALIDVAGHAEQIDAAFELLQEMKNVVKGPGSITYSALMGVCCNTGNWERAIELYEEIKATGLPATISTFNALITSLCNSGQLQKSLSILQEMRQAGISPNQITYSILLETCQKADEPGMAFDLYSCARSEGVIPNQGMCDSLLGLCFVRILKGALAPDFPSPIGIVPGSGKESPSAQWAVWALAVYRQTVAAGVIPTIRSLSLLLGCLRIPEPGYDDYEDLGFYHQLGFERQRSSVLDGFGIYDPRALALFEEAAFMGVVPHFSFTSGPITLNAELMPSFVAEVCLLTLLKGFKHRHAAGAQLFPMTIHIPVEKKKIPTPANCTKEIAVSGRSGQAVAALLRRVKLPYQGHESSGKIRIPVAAIRKWLKPSHLPLTLTPVYRRPELGPQHTLLAKSLAQQQRAIRMRDTPSYSPIQPVGYYSSGMRESNIKSSHSIEGNHQKLRPPNRPDEGVYKTWEDQVQ